MWMLVSVFSKRAQIVRKSPGRMGQVDFDDSAMQLYRNSFCHASAAFPSSSITAAMTMKDSVMIV